MRILCIVMAVFFLALTCLSLANIFIEWDGCKSCENCAAEVSSRLKSIFLTIVLGVCCYLWCWLLWDACAYARYKKLQQRAKENQYKETMSEIVTK